MSTYQTLSALVPDGYGRITSLNVDITIDGVRWSVPQPLIAIGGNMAIGPEIAPDGTDLRIRLGHWVVYQLTPVVAMPVWLPTQSIAVAFARDFARDSSISFDHDRDTRDAWSNAWLSSHPDAVVPSR